MITARLVTSPMPSLGAGLIGKEEMTRQNQMIIQSGSEWSEQQPLNRMHAM